MNFLKISPWTCGSLMGAGPPGVEGGATVQPGIGILQTSPLFAFWKLLHLIKKKKI